MGFDQRAACVNCGWVQMDISETHSKASGGKRRNVYLCAGRCRGWHVPRRDANAHGAAYKLSRWQPQCYAGVVIMLARVALFGRAGYFIRMSQRQECVPGRPLVSTAANVKK
jgi:hypothetical protein